MVERFEAYVEGRRKEIIHYLVRCKNGDMDSILADYIQESKDSDISDIIGNAYFLEFHKGLRELEDSNYKLLNEQKIEELEKFGEKAIKHSPNLKDCIEYHINDLRSKL